MKANLHVIDWDKVKTLKDIKELLMGLGITVDVSKHPKGSKLYKYLVKMEQ